MENNDLTETRRQIAVMQAFVEGKKIWFRNKKAGSDEAWAIATSPCWDWSFFDYRIELAFRPYQTAEDLLRAQRKHGQSVRLKDRPADINSSWVIAPHPDDYVIIMRQYEYDTITFDELLERYLWASDNAPCGMAEEFNNETEHENI